ncbi:hypothetical protein LIER_17172 [Lithospermum erythrorhizon]|uniref:Uncharacterized protein n=1 Tax=Lithospermum erythrorhizon TaxID=34254 RepID=A0AAV3Q9D3_LITER
MPMQILASLMEQFLEQLEVSRGGGGDVYFVGSIDDLQKETRGKCDWRFPSVPCKRNCEKNDSVLEHANLILEKSSSFYSGSSSNLDPDENGPRKRIRIPAPFEAGSSKWMEMEPNGPEIRISPNDNIMDLDAGPQETNNKGKAIMEECKII